MPVTVRFPLRLHSGPPAFPSLRVPTASTASVMGISGVRSPRTGAPSGVTSFRDPRRGKREGLQSGACKVTEGLDNKFNVRSNVGRGKAWRGSAFLGVTGSGGRRSRNSEGKTGRRVLTVHQHHHLVFLYLGHLYWSLVFCLREGASRTNSSRFLLPPLSIFSIPKQVG